MENIHEQLNLLSTFIEYDSNTSEEEKESLYLAINVIDNYVLNIESKN